MPGTDKLSARLRMKPDDPGATNALIFEIFRINSRLLATGDALVADIGLTSARWQVLGAVALASGLSPVAHIARSMGLTRQAVQRLTNDMVADGLLKLETNPNHQRARVVALTPAGREIYNVAIARWNARLAEIETLLNPADAATITDHLRRVRIHLERGVKKRSHD